MEPLPCRRNRGIASRQVRKTEVRFVRSRRSHCSSVISCSRPMWETPALFTSVRRAASGGSRKTVLRQRIPSPDLQGRSDSSGCTVLRPRAEDFGVPRRLPGPQQNGAAGGGQSQSGAASNPPGSSGDNCVFFFHNCISSPYNRFPFRCFLPYYICRSGLVKKEQLR